MTDVDEWVIGIFLTALGISVTTALYALAYHIGQTRERRRDNEQLKKVQHEIRNGGAGK